jgi:hypothetical protein
MSDFLSGHIDYLLDDNGVANLISDRLWPEHAPAQPTLPYIVLNEVHTEATHTFDGAIVVSKNLLQYSIYGSSVSSVKAVAAALTAALIAGDDPVVISDSRGMGEMTSGLHRRDLDAEVTHVGA